MATLATAFVEVKPLTSSLRPGITSAASGAADAAGTDAGRRFSSRFGSALKIGAVLAGAFAVRAGKEFFTESIREATNLNESVNAVSVTFGKNAAGIRRLGEDAADSLGLSESQFNGLAVQFASFSSTIAGKGGDVVGVFDELSTRGADFASVMNLDVNESMRLFQSGLAGETEPLRRFGIDLSAAKVEAFAYARGIAKAGKPLTEQQKVQARYALLMKQTAKTQGDFANTSDSLANSQRRLGANIDDIQARVGQKLIPVLERASGWVLGNGIPAFERFMDLLDGKGQGDLGAGVSDAFGTIQASFQDIDWKSVSSGLGDIKSAAADIGPALKTASADLPSLSDLLSVGSAAIGFFADNVDLLVKALPFLVAGFLAYKVAQAAANTAALISVPVRIAEVVAIRAQTKALQALAGTQLMTVGATAAATAATSASTTMTLRQRAAAMLSAAASKAMAVASLIWAGAQKVLNAVMRANPIGLVITAIALLVGGFILAYKKSETFRNIVDGALRAVGKAAKWLWNNAFQPAFGAVKTIIRAVGDAGIWLWNKALAPAFRSILKGVAWILDSWAKMLRALGNIPGFEWAKKAADKMAGAADKARALANGIKDIPSRKDVQINVGVRYTSTGDRYRGPGDPVGPGFQANALGTHSFRGGLTWVGEHGKELLDLPPRSRIWDHNQSARMETAAARRDGPLVHIENLIARDDADAAYRPRVEAQKLLSMMGTP